MDVCEVNAIVTNYQNFVDPSKISKLLAILLR